MSTKRLQKQTFKLAYQHRHSAYDSAYMALAQSENLWLYTGDKTYEVSIRSPHRSKGRPHVKNDEQENGKVSIRSPHRSKGRQTLLPKAGTKVWFQSAPLTEARGDKRCSPRLAPRYGFNPLPSPKQGETYNAGPGNINKACFNPLPSPKQGETLEPIAHRRHHLQVSIRFPHRSKGRPTTRVSSLRASWFQSAPLTEARGDQRLLRVVAQDNLVSIRSPHRSKGRPRR